ncbi:ABC transporter ATP-binding protein [Phenylobacterium sp.]|uniref:ABC transporter ATP-binding protein n=1 Tax=Phenylobacterium sp. TaxID=1871053 RepID=UPI00260067D2|nr:ABC transporter ATP-binding protein [Phenylobacterium sp.]
MGREAVKSADGAAVLAVYLRPEGRRLSALALFLVAGTAVQLASPQIIRAFIDTAAQGGPDASLERLWMLAGLFIAVTILAQVLQIGSTYFSEQLGWSATNRMRQDLAEHALRLDMAFHTAKSPGELIERVDGDVAALAAFFSQFILQIIGGALLLAGILVVLYLQDWRIGVLLTGFAVVAGLVLHAIRQIAGGRWERLREAWSAFSGFLEERLAGLDDVRANGGGPHVMRRMAEVNAELLVANVDAARRGHWIFLTASALFSIGFGLALALGVWLFQRGEATIGTVFMFMQYAGMMSLPIMLIGQQLQQFQAASASLKRIGDLRAITPTLTDGPGAGWEGLRTQAPVVGFKDMTFAYREDTPVIRNLDLEVPAGEVIGLLGRTGSGKTTLTRLLFRLYDPQGGAVTLDGTDIRTARLSELRGRIGLVTQEVQLFDASIRDNASLFDPAIDDARIIEVLTDLGLGDWLSRQPQGLGTVLRAGGGLSAGEAQLLAFARVFLKDPGLVVLDEASSRLDPATDQMIERALDRLLGADGSGRRRTAIIIAHKLSTVQRADRIAILDQGRLVETGRRTELEADPESAYARLLRTGLAEVMG